MSASPSTSLRFSCRFLKEVTIKFVASIKLWSDKSKSNRSGAFFRSCLKECLNHRFFVQKVFHVLTQLPATPRCVSAPHLPTKVFSAHLVCNEVALYRLEDWRWSLWPSPWKSLSGSILWRTFAWPGTRSQWVGQLSNQRNISPYPGQFFLLLEHQLIHNLVWFSKLNLELAFLFLSLLTGVTFGQGPDGFHQNGAHLHWQLLAHEMHSYYSLQNLTLPLFPSCRRIWIFQQTCLIMRSCQVSGSRMLISYLGE